MAATGPDAHALTDRILDRLIADDHGDDRWADLVLAACDGPDALTATLDGQGGTRPVRQGTEDKDAAGPEPPGAYLRSITVEGFRGIGPAATLTLTPGPGLTLVVGRNGSGKSSFAEGLEVLLTGGNRRWDGRSAVWKGGWRCLHRPDPCTVGAEFAVEALGTVTVERKWDDGAALDGSSAWFQPKGGARRPYEELGWDTAIRTHRPLLPYTELGAVFDRPSEIHDALVEVLGLGEFDQVQKTLQNARKALETIVAAAGARLTGILPRLRGAADASGDQRAVAAARALSGKKQDLDALRQVLEDHGGALADQGVTMLRQAEMQVTAPLREVVAAASRELREAASSVEQSRDTDAGRARALAKLLAEALQYHAAHASSDCPVCGTSGAIGGAWADDTRTALADLRTRADAAERAHARLHRATTTAHGLLRVPATSIEPVTAIGVESAAPALAAVTQWNRGVSIGDPLALAAHLEQHVDRLASALDAFSADVRAEISRREDLWRPLATELGNWVPQALSAAAAQPRSRSSRRRNRGSRACRPTCAPSGSARLPIAPRRSGSSFASRATWSWRTSR